MAKKSVKKSAKVSLTHVNGLECKDSGKKTDDGYCIYVDTNSNYWIHNTDTGAICKL